MPQNTLTFGNVLLCDYASRGERNKHTLVNIYSGDIVMDQLPGNLHLGLYAEYKVHDGMPPLIMISVHQAGDLRAEIRFSVEQNSLKATKVGVLLIPMFEMGVEREGDLEIVAKADGFEPTVILSKSVKRSPNALPPPSSQSPSGASGSETSPAQPPQASPTRRRRRNVRSPSA
jgi:hypothetical protein